MKREAVLDLGIVESYFLSKSSMTRKKLNTLMYYSYVWYLVFENDVEDFENKKYKVLFKDYIEAWSSGPVISNVYENHRDVGWGEIEKIPCEVSILDLSVSHVLDEVWRVYSGYNADELRDMALLDYPFTYTRRGLGVGDDERRVIKDVILYTYYNSLI